MQIPAKLMEFLNQSKVRYQWIHHPEAFTAQELAAIENIKGKNHAKVVMVKVDGGVFMAVLPADHRVDLEKLDKIVGKPTQLATEADFKALFPDCAIGTMPPFGSLYNVTTYVDQSFQDADFIVFEAGTHSDAIKMGYADYERLARPAVADFAIKLH